MVSVFSFHWFRFGGFVSVVSLVSVVSFPPFHFVVLVFERKLKLPKQANSKYSVSAHS